MTKLEQAIIKAVPEIMELKFGCKYSFTDPRYPGRAIAWLNWNESEIPDQKNKKDIKIIGRPITLEDVLRVLKKNTDLWVYSVTVNGSIVEINNVEGVKKVSEWQLGKPLSEQSEETIKFLEELIV